MIGRTTANERTPNIPHGAGWPITASLAAVLVVVIALAVPASRQSIPGFRPDPASAEVPNAFLYQQQRPLSCEYASVHVAAAMLGYTISEFDIEAVVPLNPNPHKGYRGNILGQWGNTTDYGVYNQPLSRGLDQLGIPHEAYYGDRKDLERQLRAGHPTVVWLGMRGEGYSVDEWDTAGDRFQLTTYMHVMTAYGFDAGGVFLTDPGQSVWQFYRWDEFLAMWNVMDGMALSILPPG